MPALQETLVANFEGTRKVLELAAAAGHLKALVHVSSAFVNMNQPRSSIVDEQVYPLKYGHQAVDVEELARVSCHHHSRVQLGCYCWLHKYVIGRSAVVICSCWKTTVTQWALKSVVYASRCVRTQNSG
jgi:hypothetical protein